MSKKEKEKLNELRDWLISETEKYQDRTNCSGASDYDRQHDSGTAQGLLMARDKLEHIFDYLWEP